MSRQKIVEQVARSLIRKYGEREHVNKHGNSMEQAFLRAVSK